MIKMGKYVKYLRDSSGYAIIYVLFVTMLLLSSLAAFSVLKYFYNNMSLKALAKERLNSACYSAVQIAISDTNCLHENSFIINHDSINVNVNIQQIGLYALISASAKSHNDSSLYQCFVSEKLRSPFKNAITISHPNSNITVAGVTHITGDILSSAANITKGNIFGIRNSSENYLEGKILKETNIKASIFNDSLIMPLFNYDNVSLDSTCLQLKSLVIDNSFLSTYSQGQKFIVNGQVTIKDNLNSKNYKYYDITARDKVYFYTNTSSNVKLIIKSDSSIIIDKGCNLENELLVSKSKIIIAGSQFKNVQMFSKDSLLISDSNFRYPSVIVGYTARKDSLMPAKLLSIKNSVVNGAVMLLYPVTGVSGNKSKIVIDEKSKVQGVIYSENNIEISGNITSSVYTYNFWYYKDPGEYINWLVNTNINRNKLDKWFLLPLGFDGKHDYEILDEKWIY
jgi:hypothetical protein